MTKSLLNAIRNASTWDTLSPWMHHCRATQPKFQQAEVSVSSLHLSNSCGQWCKFCSLLVKLLFLWRAASVCSHLKRASWHLSKHHPTTGFSGFEGEVYHFWARQNNNADTIGWDRTGHVELLKQNNVLIAPQSHCVCTLQITKMNGCLL